MKMFILFLLLMWTIFFYLSSARAQQLQLILYVSSPTHEWPGILFIFIILTLKKFVCFSILLLFALAWYLIILRTMCFLCLHHIEPRQMSSCLHIVSFQLFLPVMNINWRGCLFMFFMYSSIVLTRHHRTWVKEVENSVRMPPQWCSSINISTKLHVTSNGRF